VRWQGKGGPTAFITGKDPAVVSSGRGLLLQVVGDEREEVGPFDLSKNTQGGVSPRRGWRKRLRLLTAQTKGAGAASSNPLGRWSEARGVTEEFEGTGAQWLCTPKQRGNAEEGGG
jgi:hypothetical protein